MECGNCGGEVLWESPIIEGKSKCKDCGAINCHLAEEEIDYTDGNYCRKMTEITAIFNQKGGVGKTTLTYQIGLALAKLGYKVLLIDADSQANLSSLFTKGRVPKNKTLENVLSKKIMIQDAIITEQLKAGELSLIATTTELAEMEEKMGSMVARELRLKKELAKIKSDYDYILIDCPPSVLTLTMNAIVASDSIIIPFNPDMFSLYRINFIIDAIESIAEELEMEKKILGMIPNMWENTKLAKEALEAAQKFNLNLFTPIKKSVKVKEYTLEKKSIENLPVNFDTFFQEFLESINNCDVAK